MAYYLRCKFRDEFSEKQIEFFLLFCFLVYLLDIQCDTKL